MRVCPKCKYVDPPEWLHNKFSYHIDSCQYPEFQRLYPKLAEEIEKTIVEDKDYYYRLNKTQTHVMRKAKVDCFESKPFGAERYEKVDHKTPWRKWKQVKCKIDYTFRKCHPSQTKLVGSKELPAHIKERGLSIARTNEKKIVGSSPTSKEHEK